MSTLKFTVSNLPVIDKDATIGFTTDTVEWVFSPDWSVSFTPVGVDGSGTYTIEVSNDKIKWDKYDSNSTDVSIQNSFEWDYFGFRYIRVIYTPAGVTTGTISAFYTINNNNLVR